MRRPSKETTSPGYRNKNLQRVIAPTGKRGTDYGQSVYVLQCGECTYRYGANGSDIWQRKCPKCQGGKPGLKF